MYKKVSIVFLFICFKSVASDIDSGKIVEVRTGAWYGEVVAIKTNPQPIAEECSNLGAKGHYLIDTSKPGGDNLLSVVLTAKATGKEVQIWGTGTCLTFNGNHRGEEVETIALK